MTLTTPRHVAGPYPRTADGPTVPTPRPESRVRVVARSIRFGLGYGLLAVVLLLATVTILVPRLTGSVPLTVLSGSMEPALPVGSLVVVRPVAPVDVQVGDVVTYLPYPDDPTAVTHRVIGITHRADGGRTFLLQGDANGAPDLPVQDFQVRARVWYVVHHLGHVSSAVNGDERHVGVYVVAGVFFVWALRLWRRSWRDRRTPADVSAGGLGPGVGQDGGPDVGQGAQPSPVRHP